MNITQIYRLMRKKADPSVKPWEWHCVRVSQLLFYTLIMYISYTYDNHIIHIYHTEKIKKCREGEGYPNTLPKQWWWHVQTIALALRLGITLETPWHIAKPMVWTSESHWMFGTAVQDILREPPNAVPSQWFGLVESIGLALCSGIMGINLYISLSVLSVCYIYIYVWHDYDMIGYV